MFHPDHNEPRWWFVVQVNPRARKTWMEMEIDMEEVTENVMDTIPQMDEDVEVSLDIEHVSNIVDDNEQVDNFEDDHEEDDPIGIEDEEDVDSQNLDLSLFISLRDMGLEVDEEVCNDLIQDTLV